MNRPPDGASGGEAVWDAGSRRLGYAIRRRIAALERYTLATPIFEGERIGRPLGFDPFTANQREASWRFWRGVAEQMPLGGCRRVGSQRDRSKQITVGRR